MVINATETDNERRRCPFERADPGELIRARVEFSRRWIRDRDRAAGR